mmetsp:Transcript_112653/g.351215  ORF Transcript_112653/g.351215 Transcript_112653/m.351215 type:complete len:263 (-) Transcript_112653:91-879(-)
MDESDFQELWEASGVRQLMLQAWSALLPADVATPTYITRLRGEALDVARSLPAIRAYLISAGCDYTSVFCPEVSLEDAFFWRDDHDALDCGLFDFRTVKMGHVCECFAGLHLAPADMRIAHTSGFVRLFTDVAAEHGGPALDAAEVLLQLALYDMVRILEDILYSARATYMKLEPGVWEHISSREDPALTAGTRASLELRRGLAAFVDGVVAWKGLGYHATLEQWRSAVEALPLSDRLCMRLAPALCSRRARAQGPSGAAGH